MGNPGHNAELLMLGRQPNPEDIDSSRGATVTQLEMLTIFKDRPLFRDSLQRTERPTNSTVSSDVRKDDPS